MKASPIRCLVTAGPTREYLDPVRFISNPSSGKMGYALAEAAIERGWEVDLVSGPVALTPPKEANFNQIETAEELKSTLLDLFPQSNVLLMAAAVSDFRPVTQLARKEKKHEARFVLDLAPTPDCLQELGAQKGQRILVGFAAETENLEENGLLKLQNKNLDWIAVTRVGPNTGFQVDENEILLLGADGSRRTLGPAPKIEIARDLLDALALDSSFTSFSA